MKHCVSCLIYYFKLTTENVKRLGWNQVHLLQRGLAVDGRDRTRHVTYHLFIFLMASFNHFKNKITSIPHPTRYCLLLRSDFVRIQFHVIRGQVSVHCLAHLTCVTRDVFLIQLYLPPLLIVPTDDDPDVPFSIHSLFIRLIRIHI